MVSALTLCYKRCLLQTLSNDFNFFMDCKIDATHWKRVDDDVCRALFYYGSILLGFDLSYLRTRYPKLVSHCNIIQLVIPGSPGYQLV